MTWTPRTIRPGMAFYSANANTKFWIYKRNGEWRINYPFRYPNIHLQGYKVPTGSFEECISEFILASKPVQ